MTIHQIWNCSMNLLVWDHSPLKMSGGAPLMASLVPWGACPICCSLQCCCLWLAPGWSFWWWLPSWLPSWQPSWQSGQPLDSCWWLATWQPLHLCWGSWQCLALLLLLYWWWHLSLGQLRPSWNVSTSDCKVWPSKRPEFSLPISRSIRSSLPQVSASCLAVSASLHNLITSTVSWPGWSSSCHTNC
jgi:hypothetical protein